MAEIKLRGKQIRKKILNKQIWQRFNWILVKTGKENITAPKESWGNWTNRPFTQVDDTFPIWKLKKKNTQKCELISQRYQITEEDQENRADVRIVLAFWWQVTSTRPFRKQWKIAISLLTKLICLVQEVLFLEVEHKVEEFKSCSRRIWSPRMEIRFQ